jgi:tRNA1(Val) A37 N6-methylase TrmN6
MRKTPPPGEAPGPGETLDQLIDDWWVFQLKGGHRFSTDDLVCAWRAAIARPDAERLLDLGSGIGSVGLYTLGLLRNKAATLTGIEAQEVSHGLAKRSVVRNGLADRVTMLHGDLRDSAALLGGATFPLITGSPPYIPVGKGLLSPHPQRAACRIELRGSIVDYCAAAARHLAPQGRFSFVMANGDPRIEAGMQAARLAPVEVLDVTFRAGSPPLICVVVCAHADEVRGPPERVSLTIRDEARQMTDAYRNLRLSMGFSVDG